jgi:FAD-dependent urate hydroxylase
MSEPPSQKTTIAIIGAGIAGPVFALQVLSHPILAQRYKPVIYERLPASSAAGGAAVALTSNALFPLYSLGLKEELDAVSCETERIKIWRAYGTVGKYLNKIFSPNWQEDLGTCLRVVERKSLQGLLLQRVRELGGEVVWGKRVRTLERVEGENEGGVRLAFEGGEEEVAGLVVGADGGWSEVRRLITSKAKNGDRQGSGEGNERWKPEFAGADAIYGVSRPAERDGGDAVDEGAREGDTHWVFLESGMGSTWALREGKVFWTISYLSKTPPDRKIEVGEARRGEDDKLYGANVSLGGYEVEDTKRILEKYENVWHPVVGNFGNLFRNSERIVRTPLWYRAWEGDEIGGENMVLIGDAARLMLPTSGQGNCSQHFFIDGSPESNVSAEYRN